MNDGAVDVISEWYDVLLVCEFIFLPTSKGKFHFFFFLSHAVRRNRRCMPCVPLCIPNIDCPTIASVFTQSSQDSHHRFHHT